MKSVTPKQYDVVLRQLYGDYMQIQQDKDKYKHQVNVIQENEKK